MYLLFGIRKEHTRTQMMSVYCTIISYYRMYNCLEIDRPNGGGHNKKYRSHVVSDPIYIRVYE